MLKITYSDRFIKHYRKLTDVEKRQLKSKLSMFADDPFHPSLRTKRIQGTDALFEFSVNMDIRVIWFFDGEDVVILLDVGHHDILREY
ncbi:MAG: cytotoxin [Eubacteriaceae bacterium]|nr:cytotoxin [Eubacteriaceae bacterium]